ncbi:MAG: hypothetical protein CL578_17820 [Alteromonadaceae bacterium]|nr:hypothetical protein [Alteromonadaceae bacterium]|tara:strand:+ start:2388 stop:2609 length:222 start_codon:yes stop_codon:yes gene_type:complete
MCINHKSGKLIMTKRKRNKRNKQWGAEMVFHIQQSKLVISELLGTLKKYILYAIFFDQFSLGYSQLGGHLMYL